MRTKRPKAPKLTYSELLQEEELDRLQENARTHRINRALAGRRCPSIEGVIRLLKKGDIK